MDRVRNRVRTLKLVLAAGVAAPAMLLALPGVAAAQQTPDAQKIGININGGGLAEALIALGRQTSVEIAFMPESVAGRKVKPLRGTLTVDQALKRLLANTGLSYRQVRPGSYYVSGRTARKDGDASAAEDQANIYANVPEILVQGISGWTLNTDIKRGQDEAQPYTVFDREQIKRSGVTSIEEFFRDYLGSNTSVRTARQGNGYTGNDSAIDLRGFGYEGTLILVDGRRYAEPNNGDIGDFRQSSISGIPIEQIERIEVLASSAAGQYGSNAVGGVINIILRRDYQGVQLGAYLGGSTRGDAIERRLSVNATIPIFSGTSLTLSGSWKKSDPLYSKDRPFIGERIDHVLLNNPTYLSGNAGLVFSTTPNIRSATGGNLVLKPQYAVNGVTNLGSRITFIPEGYQGIGVDGAAALIANAGQQNTEPGPGNTGGIVYGDRSILLSGGTVWGGSAAVRSEVTDWLSLYGTASYSRVESISESNPAPATLTLRANSPVNPFTQAIEVTFPSAWDPVIRRSKSETTGIVAGAIVQLPWKWQANLDAAASWGKSGYTNDPIQLSQPFYNSFNTAQTVDVLRDTLAYPIAFEFDTQAHPRGRRPSKSSSVSYSAKLAGPISFARLWGGEPVVTLTGETRRQWFGDSIGVLNQYDGSSIGYMPTRSVGTRSAFGEIVLPIIGADNHVPAIHGFELRLSGRYDAYKGRGANSGAQCVPFHPGLLTQAELDRPCPPPDANIPYATARNDTFNPVIAAKWSVSPDIAFRGSYSTGYTPPALTSLIAVPGFDFESFGIFGLPASSIFTNMDDPMRGNEPIGVAEEGTTLYRWVSGVTGGNPDVDPQRSTSWSFGTILTPRFIPGLTLRIDWTKIKIKNAYYQPSAFSTAPEGQLRFNDFLAAFPERFTRGPVAPGDPYSVGPIIFIDARTAGLNIMKNEALDFSGDYRTPIGAGQLQVTGSATLMLPGLFKITESMPAQRTDGIVSAGAPYGLGQSLRLRGTLSTIYSTDKWSAGVRGRYHSGYWLNSAHTVNTSQGSARIGGHAEFDIFGSAKLFGATEISAGINNVLDKRSPVDVTQNLGYAPYSTPMLRSFYIDVTQKF
jgi:outer membrane receptor protein involved in Fe transport